MSIQYKAECTKSKTIRTLRVGWQAFAAAVAVAAVLTVAVVVQALIRSERTRKLDVRGSGDGIAVRATLAAPDDRDEMLPSGSSGFSDVR